MRYCTNCGCPMGDERFCNQCGTDNGVPPENTAGQLNTNVNLINLQKLDLSLITHIASVIMFVIAAMILLKVCCKQAGNIVALSVLYTGTSLFSILYFVIGMWGAIPALLFLLSIKNKNSTSVVGGAIVMIIIMIALCLINVIFAKFNGFMKFFSILTAIYKTKAVTVIVLNVLASVLGMIAPRMIK